MILSCRRLVSAFLLALFATATVAAGQTSDTTALRRRLKEGDTIVVHGVDASIMRGRVDLITDVAIDLHVMTPGVTPNEYRVDAGVTSVRFEQIAELHVLDLFDGRLEVVYRRRDSFGTLHERLKEGQLVRVIEPSGDETVGRVTDVSPSALAVIVRIDNPRDGSGRPRHEWNGVRTYTPSLVERIERPAPIWDGAVKGAIVAAVATFLATRSYCGDCPGLLAGYVMTAGIGAGIGLGIDALFGPTRIYRAPRQ